MDLGARSRGAASPPRDSTGRNETDGRTYEFTGFNMAWFVDDATVVMETSLFDDLGGLGRLALDSPDVIEPVEIVGTVHPGTGEWAGADRTDGRTVHRPIQRGRGLLGLRREPGPGRHPSRVAACCCGGVTLSLPE